MDAIVHRRRERRAPVPKGLTVVLNQPGKPLALETLPTPEIEPGGILIRNTAVAAAPGAASV
jgi:hypothetical protein